MNRLLSGGPRKGQSTLTDEHRPYTITIKEVVVVPRSYVPMSATITNSDRLKVYGNTCYYNKEQKVLMIINDSYD